MNYITIKEAADKWKIGSRVITIYCNEGRILGAVKRGNLWLIPADAERPADMRRKGAKENITVKNEYNYSLMGATYCVPGTAEQIAESFTGNPTVAALTKIQLAYYHGDIDEAFRLAKNVEPLCKTFESQVGIQILFGVCAMYRGDITLWKKARDRLKNLRCASEKETEKLRFWLAVYDSSIYDNAAWPEWFCKGRLSVLPPEYLPFARFYYAKYLLVYSYDVIRKGEFRKKDSLQYMIFSLNLVCEPFIAQTETEGAIISEIHLRLLCAASYHSAGNAEEAVFHIDKAIALALPDRLYAILAENRSTLGLLLDDRLKAADATAFRDVKKLSERLMEGWTELHNFTLGRDYSNELTAREREAARLAVYGLSNSEIGARLGVSSSTAKDYIQKALEKTGAKNRSDLARYI